MFALFCFQLSRPLSTEKLISAAAMVDLRWETNSTVLSLHSARTALRITPSFRLSRVEVGSSSSRKGASCRKARATPMR